jgi:lysophospholipase L1-like esterase
MNLRVIRVFRQLSLAIIFLANGVMFPQEEAKFTSYYYDKCSAFEILPDIEGEIIFLGDSITDRCEWDELFANYSIIRRGISGDITEGVLNRLSEITRRKPSKIFIMIGVNDLRRNYDIDSVIIKNYSQIIRSLQKDTKETKIYIQSVLPVNNKVKDAKTTNNNINALNSKLQILAAVNGIKYIDLFDRFIDEEGNLHKDLTSDGLHINGKGYLIWRDVISLEVNND